MNLRDPPKWIYSGPRRYGYPDSFTKAMYYFTVFSLIGLVPTLIASAWVIFRH